MRHMRCYVYATVPGKCTKGETGVLELGRPQQWSMGKTSTTRQEERGSAPANAIPNVCAGTKAGVGRRQESSHSH